MLGDVLFLAAACLSLYCAYKGCRDEKKETTRRDEFAATLPVVRVADVKHDNLDEHPPSYSTVCGTLLHGSEWPECAYGSQSDANPT